MRKTFLIAVCLLVCGTVAMAQSKLSTKWHCDKASQQQKLDVGDMADHSYNIVQGNCNATMGDKGMGDKTGMFTEFDEAWKANMNFHGRYNVTTDSGDKVFYSYEGSGSTDMSKPAKNNWKIVGGTGKYKDTKGSGSCTGVRNKDESGDWTCTGTYTMGK